MSTLVRRQAEDETGLQYFRATVQSRTALEMGEIVLEMGCIVKRVSFLLRNAALTPPPAERRLEVYDSSVIRERLNRSMRRRLSDDLENLIRKACMVGRPETAKELLTALRSLLELEGQQFKRDRRIADGVLERLAAEITVAMSRKAAA